MTLSPSISVAKRFNVFINIRSICVPGTNPFYCRDMLLCKCDAGPDLPVFLFST